MPPTLRGKFHREANRVRVMVRNAVFALEILAVFALLAGALGERSHLLFAAIFVGIELAVLTTSRLGFANAAMHVQFSAMILGIGVKSWTMDSSLLTVWAWAPLVPMTALAVGGPRAALRWTLAASCVFLSVVGLFGMGIRPEHPTRVGGLLVAVTGLGLIGTIVGIAGSFERDMSTALDEAEARARVLEAARVDLEARHHSLLEAQGSLAALHSKLAATRVAAE